MLIAPGLPVLADRPGADDDARRARGEVPRDPLRGRASTATAGSRARSTRTSSPATASSPCAPWGSITRNPYGWKGPCYLLTDGIFPTYDALLENIEWESYGPGNDPRCEHCGIHSGLRAVRRVRGHLEREGDRPEHGLDADGLTLACATAARGAGRAAGRAPHRAASASASAAACPPASSSRSASPAACNGLAGRHGDRRDARRRRARRGALGGHGARRRRGPGTILGDRPHRRRPGRAPPPARARPAPTRSTWRAACSPPPAASRGCVRAISDTPDASRSARSAEAVTPDGRPRPLGLAEGARRGSRARPPARSATSPHCALKALRERQADAARSCSPRRARSAPASTARSRSSSACSSSTARRSTSATTSSTTTTSSAASRGSARSSSTTRTRSRRARSASSRRTGSPRRCSRTASAAACGSSTPSARSSRRCTPRRGATPTAATSSRSSATATTSR